MPKSTLGADPSAAANWTLERLSTSVSMVDASCGFIVPAAPASTPPTTGTNASSPAAPPPASRLLNVTVGLIV